MASEAQLSRKSFTCSMLPIKHCSSPYSPSQVVEYLQAINFNPIPTWRADGVWDNFETNLEELEKLMRLHVVAFPYENLEDHYSVRGRISWKEQDVFQRMVTEKNGYGAICFGHSFLFRGILRSLGYRAIVTASRGNTIWHSSLGTPDLSPFEHSLLLVTVPGHEFPFLVDVGFGSFLRLSLLSKPVPLNPGVVTGSFVPPEEYRVMPGVSTESSLESIPSTPFGWWMQGRHSPDAPWRMIFYFTLEEYSEKDFTHIEYSMSTMPTGLARQWVFCVKVVEGPTGTLERYIVVGKHATKQIGSGEKFVIRTFKFEHERIDALQQLCGIKMDAAEALNCMAKSGIALQIQEPSRL